MVLTKKEITQSLASQELSFKPDLDEYQIQPHAIDLRLGSSFKIPTNWVLTENGREALNIDPLSKPNSSFEEVKLKQGQYFELLPKEFVLATTLEEITLDAADLMAVLYPRSSINRRGLAVDLSGIIDAGYAGKLVIPVKNNTNDQVIRLYPGERICQIVIQRLESGLEKTEQLQHGKQGAKYHRTDNVDSKTDSDEESQLIKDGNLEKLKAKHKFIA